MQHIKKLIKSMLTRKFLAAIVSAAVAFGNAMWGWGLTDDQVWSVLVPFMAFIGIEGLADIKSRQIRVQ